MDTQWLEDFMSLAETRSFSRSAEWRHVSQPAFSRRIRALEAWAGTDLVDRSVWPVRLTPAGDTLLAQAVLLQRQLQATRSMLRAHARASADTVEFAVPHSLAFTFFPSWIAGLRQSFGPLRSRLIALNVADAVSRLIEGGCDLLIAYHHPWQPISLDPARYEMLPLGEERFTPWSAPDANGQPRHALPGQPAAPLPLLGYAPGAYLAGITDQLRRQSGLTLHLDTVHETDMAEGLKAMALQGHGLAFLPASTVLREAQAGNLVPAAPAELQERLAVTLEVRAYRERPGQEEGRTAQPRNRARALWRWLSRPTPDPLAASSCV
jgi:DNA-binding transcriptional LysR family regulator